MKRESIHAAGIFIDIGQSSLLAVNGGDALALPIERGENGRLTDLCRERLTLSLRGFLSKGRAGRAAFCAIGARGVSMRRMTLPAAAGDELQRVLRLQIESEFPLSPEELAWGSQPIGAPKSPGNGGPDRQELLVAAVKKASLEDYTGILAECGVVPAFTLAALARAQLCPSPPGSCALLDIGRNQSELVCFENGVPVSVRILPWGGEAITRSIQEKLALSHDEAERLKKTMDQPEAASGPQGQALREAAQSALAALVAGIKPASLGVKLYLTGRSARDPRMAPLLLGLLGGVLCESLEQGRGSETSAAISGLMRSAGGSGVSSPLILDGGGSQGVAGPAKPATWKWAAAAVFLVLAAIFFPFAEAIVMKPLLEKKLAALEADRGRLATIDHELDFLKFLKQNQPPYLDAIYLLARSAPRGTSLESLSMGRHQQVSMRLKMANPTQVNRFRSKLIDSGWFANVIVEEQAATPDRRFAVRMTADLKPVEVRKPITAEPPGKKEDAGDDQPDFGMPPEPMMMMPPPQPMPAPTVRPPPSAPVPAPDGQDAPRPPRIRRPPRIITPDQ